MSARATNLVAVAVLSTILLSGCSLIPSGPRVVDPDDIAATAEDALEQAYDSRFRVDCGHEGVELKRGEDVSCTAIDLATDVEYDADVEITSVDGATYEIEVELDTDDPGDVPADPDAPATSGVTVPGTDIASLAAGALAPVIGFEPVDMVCLSEDVEIYVDNIEYCGFTGEDGEIVTVQVTVTTFDETTGDYEIYAEVVA